jgi:hypothetical protein
MMAIVKKAGIASPIYDQLISFADLAISEPTIIKVQPVAHGGIDAKIGAKKIETKKHSPVHIAVKPVAPPSDIPAPDSMKAVTGGTPRSEPIEMPKASTRYATAEPSKSWVRSSIAPQNRAIE